MYALDTNLKTLIDFAKANIDNPNAVFPEDTGKNSIEIKKIFLKEAINADYEQSIKEEMELSFENEDCPNVQSVQSALDDANSDIDEANGALDEIKDQADSLHDKLREKIDSSNDDGVVTIGKSEAESLLSDINDIRVTADEVCISSDHYFDLDSD